MPLAAERSPWLRGPIRLPGDPALSRLALLAGAMARGETVIEGLAESAEIAAVIAALAAGGAHVSRAGGRWHIQGLGLPGLLAPTAPISLVGAGAAAPLLVALFGGQGGETGFSGLADGVDSGLVEMFAANGMTVRREADTLILGVPRFAAPLDLTLTPETQALALPLLLAGLVTSGRSHLRLPPGPPDPGETLLAQFGAHLEIAEGPEGRELVIEGLSPLRAQAVTLPGDAALAAYPVVAALTAPDSEVTVEAASLGRDGLALLDALALLGGDITLTPRSAGVADIRARHGRLTGTTIPASLPIAAEDFAILAVAAAFAEGDTLLEGLGEGQRRFALTRALRDNGVECVEQEGGLVVRGRPRVPGGGNVAVRLDPRLAMSFLVLGMAADRHVRIDDARPVNALFPGFVSAFEHIGASFTEGDPI